MNTFQKWVKAQGGPTPAAKILRVTRQSVNNWISGRIVPPYIIAAGIYHVTKRRGPRVIFADILNCKKEITEKAASDA